MSRNKNTTYDANDIAQDLKNNVEEIATATEMTLDETRPGEFKSDDWTALREAVKEAKCRLEEIEEMIDRHETEAENYDRETDENRYETWWD